MLYTLSVEGISRDYIGEELQSCVVAEKYQHPVIIHCHLRRTLQRSKAKWSYILQQQQEIRGETDNPGDAQQADKSNLDMNPIIAH